MTNAIKNATKTRMEKSIEALKHTLAKLRTGRAHPSLLEHIMVPYYGNDSPLSQIASITVSDSRTLTVSPWERSLVSAIEKAIINSDLGLNPATAGQVIRVPLPPLTEERRRDLIKVVRSEAENARVSVRNVRRDSNNEVKELLKAKQITEDEARKTEDAIQKLTDQFVKEVDQLSEKKEAELLEV